MLDNENLVLEDTENVETVTTEEMTGEEQVVEMPVKTYTQDEVLALLQSETDKRVSQALKTQQKK